MYKGKWIELAGSIWGSENICEPGLNSDTREYNLEITMILHCIYEERSNTNLRVISSLNNLFMSV